MTVDFSDYIIFADESGDHGMASIDPEYPIFVLTFCIFRKDEYLAQVLPRIHDLKFRFFGHDAVVLHAHEIRKARGPFAMLFDPEKRTSFMDAINEAVEACPFTLLAAVIDKEKLRGSYTKPMNPYDLALVYCLERAWYCLRDLGQANRLTHILCERRGKQEDKDLELVFRRTIQGANFRGAQMPFDIVFISKESNAAGLQLADLAAHPSGRHQLKPDQPNRAFEIVAKKLRHRAGVVDGYGLKLFP